MPIVTSHMNFENKSIIAHKDSCISNTKCGCVQINTVHTARYLGMELDTNWKFYKHIDTIAVKSRKVIPILYKVKNLLSMANKKLLFEAIIMSITRYGITVFGTTSVNLIDRIQKIHNKAIKILFKNERTRKSTKDLYKDLKLLTVKQTMVYTILTQHYNTTEFKIPVDRCVRNNNNWLKLPSWRNSYGKRGLAYQIPYLFNKLPAELRNMSSKYKVKGIIKNWLVNEGF
jgi:hypothetical protein